MAGASGDRNESLKETILESLTAILSPDHVTRSNGEDQIKALEVTEGMFVVFFSLYLDANLASVSQFWNPHVSVAPSPWHAMGSCFCARGFMEAIFVSLVFDW